MSQLHLKSVLTALNMQMPVVGLGTWQANDPDETKKALNAALECGYRHFDTAYSYNNETVIGEVMDKWFRTGRIKREDIFITTKLPPTGLRPELVEKYLKKSLNALRLSYVDLYLIHTPVGAVEKGDECFPLDDKGNVDFIIDNTTDLDAIWKEMEKQVRAGRIRAIGVSNFNAKQIKRIIDNNQIKPVNVQVEMHLYNQSPEFFEACKDMGVTITAYSPLGSPGMTNFNQGRFFEGVIPVAPLQDPVVNGIASKHVKSPGQILLRFLLQLGVSVIPKSTNPERIKQNIEVFDFELTNEEMKALIALNIPNGEGRMFFRSGPFFGSMKSHPEFPY